MWGRRFLYIWITLMVVILWDGLVNQAPLHSVEGSAFMLFFAAFPSSVLAGLVLNAVGGWLQSLPSPCAALAVVWSVFFILGLAQWILFGWVIRWIQERIRR